MEFGFAHVSFWYLGLCTYAHVLESLDFKTAQIPRCLNSGRIIGNSGFQAPWLGILGLITGNPEIEAYTGIHEHLSICTQAARLGNLRLTTGKTLNAGIWVRGLSLLRRAPGLGTAGHGQTQTPDTVLYDLSVPQEGGLV